MRWRAVVAAAVATAAAQTLEVTVVDESGRPATARLRLISADGRAQPIQALDPARPVAIHPRFAELGVVVERRIRVKIPGGASRAIVDRGPEYRLVELDLKGGSGEQVNRIARLSRWTDMSARGWWSGDLHVHRAPADMPALMEAADLNLAPTITRWNDRSSIDSWEGDRPFTTGIHRAWSIDNSEDERNWGAALFFNLRTPMALYPSKAEDPPPSQTWSEARARGAFIDQEKLIWWAAPVMALLEPPDTMGLLNNHFQEEAMMANEAWGRPRDTLKYPGEAGFVSYILDLYYTYLSSGMRVAASAGSANGVLRSPLGQNRSYVHLGRRFSYAAWLKGQKAGRNFVTNGPMLLVEVNGKPPGTVLEASVGEATVEVRAESRGDLDRAEVLVDGVVAATLRPRSGASRIADAVRVRVEPGSWLAARCFEKRPAGRDPRTIRLAHTSPFYFGKEPKRSAAARQFLGEWIDEYIRRVEALPEAAMPGGRKLEWITECRRARAKLD